MIGTAAAVAVAVSVVVVVFPVIVVAAARLAVVVVVVAFLGSTMPRIGCEYRYVFRNADGRFYVQAHGWTSRSLPTAQAAALVFCKKLKIPLEALRKVS